MRPDLRPWALWLFGLLLVPAVLTVAGWRPNDVASGAIVTTPDFEPDRILDDDWYREIDLWVEERAAARGLGLWTRYQVDHELAGDSSSDEVAVGSDGWHFARGWIDVPCADLDAITRPETNGHDESVVFLVPIAKVHWLADHLAPHDRPSPCTVAARDRLRSRFATDPSWFDVNTAIEVDPADSFYRRDPHWSGAGRRRAAEALVNRIEPGLWDPDAVRPGEETLVQSLDRFLGIDREVTLPAPVVDRDVEVEIVEQSYGLDLLIWQVSRASGPDPVIPGTTYVFGDSQMAGLVPLIEPYVEELVFIGWLRTQLGPIPFDQLPPPDRVIVEATDFSAAVSFTNPAVAQATARIGEG